MRVLPYVAELGFDVLYLPPVHPIGRTYRKGRTTRSPRRPGDAGQPVGHRLARGRPHRAAPRARHARRLRAFVHAARGHDIDVALDIAFQARPITPGCRAPRLVPRRPDGTIRYAENPPRSTRTVPFDFERPARACGARSTTSSTPGPSAACASSASTTRTPSRCRSGSGSSPRCSAQHPDALFLSEAFTRPRAAQHLAQIGFTPVVHLLHLAQTAARAAPLSASRTAPSMVEYLRPNLWPNTPDILPEHLQIGGRAAFAQPPGARRHPHRELRHLRPGVRAAGRRPAARHGGVPRLREVRAQALGSRPPDSLRHLIARLNRIRREHPRAARQRTLRFFPTDNDARAAPIASRRGAIRSSRREPRPALPPGRPRRARPAGPRLPPGPCSRSTTWSPTRVTRWRARTSRARCRDRPADCPARLCIRHSATERLAASSAELPTLTPHVPGACRAIPSGTRTRSSTRCTSAPSTISVGDGIGDFRGLTAEARLPRRTSASPPSGCCRSTPRPLRDDGYDIADYYQRQPSLRHARRLPQELLARGPRPRPPRHHRAGPQSHVDQHPWFQRARRAPPGSPERDFYVWSDTPDKYQRRAHHLQGLRDARTGPGIRSPSRTTGTASIPTSPI